MSLPPTPNVTKTPLNNLCSRSLTPESPLRTRAHRRIGERDETARRGPAMSAQSLGSVSDGGSCGVWRESLLMGSPSPEAPDPEAT